MLGISQELDSWYEHLFASCSNITSQQSLFKAFFVDEFCPIAVAQLWGHVYQYNEGHSWLEDKFVVWEAF